MAFAALDLINASTILMKKIHLFSGIIVLAIFALSGQYMLHSLELASTELNAQRVMYRASHMYLFWVGSANTLLGCYWVRFEGSRLRCAQYTASIAILLAQPILLMAFWTEPPVIDTERGLTLLGCTLLLLGVILTVLGSLLNGLLREK